MWQQSQIHTTEQRIYTNLNGKPAAGVIITQQSNANTVATTAAVREKLKQVQKLYPELTWTTAYEQGKLYHRLGKRS